MRTRQKNFIFTCIRPYSEPDCCKSCEHFDNCEAFHKQDNNIEGGSSETKVSQKLLENFVKIMNGEFDSALENAGGFEEFKALLKNI